MVVFTFLRFYFCGLVSILLLIIISNNDLPSYYLVNNNNNNTFHLYSAFKRHSKILIKQITLKTVVRSIQFKKMKIQSMN